MGSLVKTNYGCAIRVEAIKVHSAREGIGALALESAVMGLNIE